MHSLALVECYTLFHLSIPGKKRCLPRLRLDSRTLLWFVQHHYQFHYLPIGWSTFIDCSASDILSRTSSLLLVSVPQLNGLSDGLTIGHLRLSDLCLHLKLALQAIDDDLQMQLAHALNHCLVGLLCGSELWVDVAKTCKEERYRYLWIYDI